MVEVQLELSTEKTKWPEKKLQLVKLTDFLKVYIVSESHHFVEQFALRLCTGKSDTNTPHSDPIACLV